jgi:5-formyltetrahydrofolate cyclo-ligase
MTRSKTQWRRALLGVRAAMPEAVRRASSAQICRRLLGLDYVREASTLLGYVAIGAEVDPAAIMTVLWRQGLSVLVPAPNLDGEPWWTTWPREPRSGRVGARLPTRDLRSPVLVLVPGVGFDLSCMRLGRGQGFYDRALAALRRRARGAIAVGLAFDSQIVQELPSESWDERVDAVVSESRAFPNPATGGRASGAKAR